MTATLTTVTSMPSPYRLAGLAGLTIGHSIVPAWSRLAGFSPGNPSPVPGFSHSNGSNAAPTIADAIRTPAGVYNVRQLVLSLSPLLDVVVSRLGQDAPGDPAARTILIDGLAASLDTSSRESTLPLGRVAQDGLRGELAQQAKQIAHFIVRNVREATPVTITDNDIAIRSPCEGHLWTPAAASLLLGHRSDAELMHLYNEWLHRLILLRDALLPFENFDDVPLVLRSQGQGVRDVEQARKGFLVHSLTGSVPHTAITDLAKIFTGRDLPRGGYGFQYAQGIVLPAFLSGSSSPFLLRYHAAKVEDKDEVLFAYEHESYFDIPRTVVTSDTAKAKLDAPRLSSQTDASLGFGVGKGSSSSSLKLQLTFDTGICVAVDVGQITRGRRYAYELQMEDQGVVPVDGHGPVTVHDAADLLALPGLITSPRTADGQRPRLHVVPAEDFTVKLALLGKLYPENVVILRRGAHWHVARGAGKGFAERFVIVDGADKVGSAAREQNGFERKERLP